MSTPCLQAFLLFNQSFAQSTRDAKAARKLSKVNPRSCCDPPHDRYRLALSSLSSSLPTHLSHIDLPAPSLPKPQVLEVQGATSSQSQADPARCDLNPVLDLPT